VTRLTQLGVSTPLINAMRDPKGTATPPPDAAKAAPAKLPEVAKANPKNTPPPAPTPNAAEKGPGLTKSAPLPPPLPAQETAPPVAVAAPVIPNAPSTPVAAPVVVVAATKQVSVPDGRPFKMTLSANIPSDAAQGAVIRFTVAEDLKVGDTVVIAKGAQATGEIVQAAKKRLFGGSKATMRLTSVQTVDGGNHAIRALSARSGKGDPVRQVEGGAKPKSDDIAVMAGTEFYGYLDGEASVNVKK
jgi:hypothetical protein